jgi:hypothetical protein
LFILEVQQQIRMIRTPSMFIFFMKRYPLGSCCLHLLWGFHSLGKSRQLAESTTTRVLDELIEAYPQRIELFRTRGIVRTFLDDYTAAIKDFTHALKEARSLRKARSFHLNGSHPSQSSKGKGDKKKKESKKKLNGQAPPNGTSAADGCGDASEPETPPVHPSVLPDAPEPIEPQLLFLRGAAYLQNAIFLVEERILKLEGIRKRISAEGAAELRLCYIQSGRYGGVEIGNLDGPLGKVDGPKLQAYRGVLADGAFREQVGVLLKKSIRDHERFLAHFDALETPAPPPPTTTSSPEPDGSDVDGDVDVDDEDDNIVERAAYAFLLSEALRPGSHGTPPPAPLPNAAVLFTTYHPLLVESHFSMLLCLLMLGDFPALLRAFVRAANVVDGLEGYPVFLPPRSMAQAEFVETLDRLAGSWRVGVQPHSRARARTNTNNNNHHNNGKLAIEPPPLPAPAVVPATALPTFLHPSEPSTSSSSSSTTSWPASASASGSGSGSASASTSALALLSPPTSRLATPSPSPTPTPATHGGSNGTILDLVESLDCARIILAPVAERQRARAAEHSGGALEKSKFTSSSSSSLSSSSAVGAGAASGEGGGRATAAAGSSRLKPMPINISLHGPRVDVVLAWLAAVWLVELESVA